MGWVQRSRSASHSAPISRGSYLVGRDRERVAVVFDFFFVFFLRIGLLEIVFLGDDGRRRNDQRRFGLIDEPVFGVIRQRLRPREFQHVADRLHQFLDLTSLLVGQSIDGHVTFSITLAFALTFRTRGLSFLPLEERI